MDYDYLKQEVTEHRNYLTAEEHIITKGMERREKWREQMDQITRELSVLITTITSNNIPRTDVDISTLENKVNTLQDLLPEVIKSIEEADREQCLFFDHPTNPHPLKIPSYSGSFSEDFTTFKSDFKEAARDNKISKTDQLRVLQNVLTGNAKHLIYLGDETSTNHAWLVLEEAYGDPHKRTYRATSLQTAKLWTSKPDNVDPTALGRRGLDATTRRR